MCYEREAKRMIDGRWLHLSQVIGNLTFLFLDFIHPSIKIVHWIVVGLVQVFAQRHDFAVAAPAGGCNHESITETKRSSNLLSLRSRTRSCAECSQTSRRCRATREFSASRPPRSFGVQSRCPPTKRRPLSLRTEDGTRLIRHFACTCTQSFDCCVECRVLAVVRSYHKLRTSTCKQELNKRTKMDR